MLAKVTGRSKYAEDFRADGMLFAKLLLSPMPHARITGIDASAALAMPGVHAVITADDLPMTARGGATRRGDGEADMAMTNEALYEGEPILAIAAESEALAVEALERVVVDLEPLPFCVDPLRTLRPDGPNPRAEGNVWVKGKIETIKWNEEDIREIDEGRLPFRDTPSVRDVGDVEAGFAEASLVLDETFYAPSTSQQALEPRSALAYWRNGKLHLFGSSQSHDFAVRSIAEWMGLDPSDIVYVAEYCGGGFGGKIPGHVSVVIPAFLSKKTGRPVMLRVSREEEHYLGGARPTLHIRAKVGFRDDGRITAMDVMVVEDGGPYNTQPDSNLLGSIIAAVYQPPNFRYRSIQVLSNTPPRVSQRGPGCISVATTFEPIMSKAARQLGLDQVALRIVNAPGAPGPGGKPPIGFAKEALAKGAQEFNWVERVQRSGQRRGSKVTGVGVSLGNFIGGYQRGLDGLLLVRPDGVLQIHQGIGNLGTLSVFDTARVAPDVLGLPWERCEVVWGDTNRGLPYSASQSGSSTVYAHTAANHAAALDLKAKLQRIAARVLGGASDDYDVDGGRVFRRGNRSRGLEFAEAAKRAVELGGEFDGHSVPENIHDQTKAAVAKLVGQGLIGVAKEVPQMRGLPQSFVAGFSEIELDLETGAFQILDYLAVVDCGTVVHPIGLEAQMHGGGIQGIGHVRSQHWVYDQHYGVPLAKRMYQNRPPTILDIPEHMGSSAVGLPEPSNPIGAKGMGEVAMASAGSVLCAIADAIGDDMLRRTPANPSRILASIDAGRRVDEGLETYV